VNLVAEFSKVGCTKNWANLYPILNIEIYCRLSRKNNFLVVLKKCSIDFLIKLATSGVLQEVSLLSTSTFPMREAAAIAFQVNDSQHTPIAIRAVIIA
jgi:hypothetical protein